MLGLADLLRNIQGFDCISNLVRGYGQKKVVKGLYNFYKEYQTKHRTRIKLLKKVGKCQRTNICEHI